MSLDSASIGHASTGPVFSSICGYGCLASILYPGRPPQQLGRLEELLGGWELHLGFQMRALCTNLVVHACQDQVCLCKCVLQACSHCTFLPLLIPEQNHHLKLMS